MTEEIKNILKKIVWDYEISPKDIYLCLKDKIEKAGFYDKTALIIKMLENLSWYEIIEVIGFEEIKRYLTKENVNKIYPKGLRDKYAILRKLLYRETISSSGWDSKDNGVHRYPLLSNRWYCSK